MPEEAVVYHPKSIGLLGEYYPMSRRKAVNFLYASQVISGICGVVRVQQSARFPRCREAILLCWKIFGRRMHFEKKSSNSSGTKNDWISYISSWRKNYCITKYGFCDGNDALVSAWDAQNNHGDKGQCKWHEDNYSKHGLVESAQALARPASTMTKHFSMQVWQRDMSLDAAHQVIQEHSGSEMIMLWVDEQEKQPNAADKTRGSPKGASSRPKDYATAGHGDKPMKGGLFRRWKGFLKGKLQGNQVQPSLALLSNFAQDVMTALYEAFLDDVETEFAKEVGKKKSYFTAAVGADEGRQLILLRTIEQFCKKSIKLNWSEGSGSGLKRKSRVWIRRKRL